MSSPLLLLLSSSQQVHSCIHPGANFPDCEGAFLTTGSSDCKSFMEWGWGRKGMHEYAGRSWRNEYAGCERRSDKSRQKRSAKKDDA
eukprot:766434-Hanusia_phi.AAC.1